MATTVIDVLRGVARIAREAILSKTIYLPCQLELNTRIVLYFYSCFRSMHALSASLGKEVSVFIQWTVTCVGAYVLALTSGWKVALACIAFSPLIFITGTFLTKVGPT